MGVFTYYLLFHFSTSNNKKKLAIQLASKHLSNILWQGKSKTSLLNILVRRAFRYKKLSECEKQWLIFFALLFSYTQWYNEYETKDLIYYIYIEWMRPLFGGNPSYTEIPKSFENFNLMLFLHNNSRILTKYWRVATVVIFVQRERNHNYYLRTVHRVLKVSFN